ncbi:TIGR03808 family TAT-translocated repetitive protein [Devosia lacusdianchii]|uniref:TIGR03808 family TAT-translocated repetitive protein n=1 Tax=Devosia lacusdianchii TaxID=2917991 RepID=UPI001F05BAF3|nr:TIGR03808 family TAT-translocated repetitive protein [Devosia sp. JXJ CY 41]
MTKMLLANRRRILAGLATVAVATPTLARAQTTLDATTLGVAGDTTQDQTSALQSALDQAAAAGQTLRLPPGIIHVLGIDLPGNLAVEGVPGRTEITTLIDGSGVAIRDRGSVVLRDIGFASGLAALTIEASESITLERCHFRTAGTGVAISNSGVTISNCRFTELGDAAIHSMDSRGLLVTGNHIDLCGNAGIRIWRSESGPDGSIVTGNRIANIDWRDGGNGQNGNGINIFRADEVIVSDNHIADCAFSAIRLNTTNNTHVSNNTCLRSRESAIFSEFGFSGSVIANNIVDSAAFGISMTNFDQGGQLAVCTGNIVRNILPSSPVNPDSSPVGIAAQANAAVTGNIIQNVPGIAIVAGYGPYLQNVLISSNVISGCDVGIGVSVAPDAGPVHITDNMIYQPLDHAVIGMAWEDIVEPDLLNNAARYPNVTVG